MSQYAGPRHQADDRERRKWQNPEAILADIGVKPGSTFIDVGCGGGFFTLPAARMVGAGGKVYGIDVDEPSLREMRELADKEGLRNLALTVGKAEEVALCQACADLVFFGIALHDFNDPARVLVNARKMLKPAGHLVDLDWKKEPMKLGPPLSKRFAEGDAVRLIEVAGFSIETIEDSGSYHYLVITRLAQPVAFV